MNKKVLEQLADEFIGKLKGQYPCSSDFHLNTINIQTSPVGWYLLDVQYYLNERHHNEIITFSNSYVSGLRLGNNCSCSTTGKECNCNKNNQNDNG